MKNLFFLLFLALISCNDTNQKASSNPVEKPHNPTKKPASVNNAAGVVKDASPLKEKRYVNTTTRLNYRDKPNGKVLGKFHPNDEVFIIEKTNVFTEIKIDNKLVKGQWVGVRLGKDTVYVFDAFLSLTRKKSEVWSKFPMKKMPLTETTNFDNIKKKAFLTAAEIKDLELIKQYPDLENGSYKFAPAYQLDFGNFKSIVVHVFKGEHELETILIIYDENDKFVQYHGNAGLRSNTLVLAYDEIAEGWSKTTAEIKDKQITIVDALYTDTPKIDTLLYHVNKFGEIYKVDTDFASNIRPGKEIKRNTVYTDTISFVAYNNDLDYFFFEGMKNNESVSLNYNWDQDTEKYSFKENDLLLVKWEMGEFLEAGEGDVLYFSEFAIEAEKLDR